MTHVVGEILTYSGRYVTPLALKPEQVDISDIAHALSMQCRYSGHTSQFYSVAQHSVLCVDYLRHRGASEDVQRQALLHDAAEAYLQDMARPLKEAENFGAAYRDAEFEIELVLAEVFNIEFPFDPAVKEADLALLALERQELMPAKGHWGLLDGISVPTDIEIKHWPPEVAKVFFLREFERLYPIQEAQMEEHNPFEGFEVLSLEDFLAGRFDKAVPIEQFEGETVDEYVERLHVSDAPAPDHFEGSLGANIAGGRHPNSARFHELLEEAGAMHDRKQADYGRGDDPFANVRASEDWGIEGWVGAMVRLNDKVKRLQSLATKGHLVNESAKDSLMDIAVYALIAYVLYEQQYEQAA